MGSGINGRAGDNAADRNDYHHQGRCTHHGPCRHGQDRALQNKGNPYDSQHAVDQDEMSDRYHRERQRQDQALMQMQRSAEGLAKLTITKFFPLLTLLRSWSMD